MREWLWKFRLVFALLALIPTYFAWAYAELRWGIPARGRMDAYRNFRNGTLTLLRSHGYRESPPLEYDRRLKERYKVEFKAWGGCVILRENAIYEDSYNDEMRKRINSRYGKDVFEECRRGN